MVNIAVIGIGGWGKNILRSFNQLADANLRLCCDLDGNKWNEQKALYPAVKFTKKAEEIFNDPDVEAVVIAASAAAHFKLAKGALEANKHVFVEKPLTLKVEETEELIRLSKLKKKKLMVGHLLKYHPAVEKLREFIEGGKLGRIYYIYSQRVNLGKIRKDENALWSFAPHDISVILYLVGDEPDSVSARGEAYIRPDIEDVVFLNLHFKDRKMAHIHLSWLDPHKTRKMTIVGSEKMVVFDDMQPSEKIKMYDKGAIVPGEYLSYSDAITLKEGDVYIPALKMKEPLICECQHFLDCIKSDREPLTNGEDGLRVVRILNAAQESLKKDGVPVKIRKEKS